MCSADFIALDRSKIRTTVITLSNISFRFMQNANIYAKKLFII